MKRAMLAAALLAGLTAAGTAWGESQLLDPSPFGPDGTSLRSTTGQTRTYNRTPDSRPTVAAPVRRSRSLDDRKIWWQ